MAKIIDIQKTSYQKATSCSDDCSANFGDDQRQQEERPSRSALGASNRNSAAAGVVGANQAAGELQRHQATSGGSTSALGWPQVSGASSARKQQSGETLSSFESDYDLLVYLGETETEDIVDTERSLDYQDQTWRQSICGGASLAPTLADESLSELLGGPQSRTASQQQETRNSDRAVNEFPIAGPSTGSGKKNYNHHTPARSVSNLGQHSLPGGESHLAPNSETKSGTWSRAQAGPGNLLIRSAEDQGSDQECDQEVSSLFNQLVPRLGSKSLPAAERQQAASSEQVRVAQAGRLTKGAQGGSRGQEEREEEEAATGQAGLRGNLGNKLASLFNRRTQQQSPRTSGADELAGGRPVEPFSPDTRARILAGASGEEEKLEEDQKSKGRAIKARTLDYKAGQGEEERNNTHMEDRRTQASRQARASTLEGDQWRQPASGKCRDSSATVSCARPRATKPEEPRRARHNVNHQQGQPVAALTADDAAELDRLLAEMSESLDLGSLAHLDPYGGQEPAAWHSGCRPLNDVEPPSETLSKFNQSSTQRSPVWQQSLLAPASQRRPGEMGHQREGVAPNRSTLSLAAASESGGTANNSKAELVTGQLRHWQPGQRAHTSLGEPRPARAAVRATSNNNKNNNNNRHLQETSCESILDEYDGASKMLEQMISDQLFVCETKTSKAPPAQGVGLTPQGSGGAVAPIVESSNSIQRADEMETSATYSNTPTSESRNSPSKLSSSSSRQTAKLASGTRRSSRSSVLGKGADSNNGYEQSDVGRSRQAEDERHQDKVRKLSTSSSSQAESVLAPGKGAPAPSGEPGGSKGSSLSRREVYESRNVWRHRRPTRSVSGGGESTNEPEGENSPIPAPATRHISAGEQRDGNRVASKKVIRQVSSKSTHSLVVEPTHTFVSSGRAEPPTAAPSPGASGRRGGSPQAPTSPVAAARRMSSRSEPPPPVKADYDEERSDHGGNDDDEDKDNIISLSAAYPEDEDLAESQIGRMKRRTLSSMRSMRNRLSDFVGGGSAEPAHPTGRPRPTKRKPERGSQSSATSRAATPGPPPPRPPRRSSSIGGSSQASSAGGGRRSGSLTRPKQAQERESRSKSRRHPKEGQVKSTGREPSSFGQQLRERLSRSKSRLSRFLRGSSRKSPRAQSSPNTRAPDTVEQDDSKLFTPGDIARNSEPPIEHKKDEPALGGHMEESLSLERHLVVALPDSSPAAKSSRPSSPSVRNANRSTSSSSSSSSNLSGLETGSARAARRAKPSKRRSKGKDTKEGRRSTSLLSIRRLSALRPGKGNEKAANEQIEDLDLITVKTPTGPDTSRLSPVAKRLATTTTDDYFGQVAPARPDTPEGPAPAPAGSARSLNQASGEGQQVNGAKKPARSLSVRSAGATLAAGSLSAQGSAELAPASSFNNLSNRRLHVPSALTSFRPVSACAKLAEPARGQAPRASPDPSSVAATELAMLAGSPQAMAPVRPSNSPLAGYRLESTRPVQLKEPHEEAHSGKSSRRAAKRQQKAAARASMSPIRAKSAAVLDDLRARCSELFGSTSASPPPPSLATPTPPGGRARPPARAPPLRPPRKQGVAATPTRSKSVASDGPEVKSSRVGSGNRLTSLAYQIKESASDFFHQSSAGPSPASSATSPPATTITTTAAAKQRRSPAVPVPLPANAAEPDDLCQWRPVIASSGQKSRPFGLGLGAPLIRSGKDEEEHEATVAAESYDRAQGGTTVDKKQQQALDTDSTWDESSSSSSDEEVGQAHDLPASYNRSAVRPSKSAGSSANETLFHDSSGLIEQRDTLASGSLGGNSLGLRDASAASGGSNFERTSHAAGAKVSDRLKPLVAVNEKPSNEEASRALKVSDEEPNNNELPAGKQQQEQRQHEDDEERKQREQLLPLEAAKIPVNSKSISVAVASSQLPPLLPSQREIKEASTRLAEKSEQIHGSHTFEPINLLPQPEENISASKTLAFKFNANLPTPEQLRGREEAEEAAREQVKGISGVLAVSEPPMATTLRSGTAPVRRPLAAVDAQLIKSMRHTRPSQGKNSEPPAGVTKIDPILPGPEEREQRESEKANEKEKEKRLSAYENVSDSERSKREAGEEEGEQQDKQQQAHKLSTSAALPPVPEPKPKPATAAAPTRERQWRRTQPAPAPPQPLAVTEQNLAAKLASAVGAQIADMAESGVIPSAEDGNDRGKRAASSPPDSPANWSVGDPAPLPWRSEFGAIPRADDSMENLNEQMDETTISQFTTQPLPGQVVEARTNEAPERGVEVAGARARPKPKLVTMTSIIQEPNDALMIGATSSSPQEAEAEAHASSPALVGSQPAQAAPPTTGGAARRPLQRRDSALSIGAMSNYDDDDDTDSSLATAAANRQRLVSRFEPTALAAAAARKSSERPPKFPAFAEGKSALETNRSGGGGGSLVKRLAKSFDRTAQEQQAVATGSGQGQATASGRQRPPLAPKPATIKTRSGGETQAPLVSATGGSFDEEAGQSEASSWHDASSGAEMPPMELDEAEVADFLRNFDPGALRLDPHQASVGEGNFNQRQQVMVAATAVAGERKIIAPLSVSASGGELSGAESEVASVSTGAEPFVTVAESTLAESGVRGDAAQVSGGEDDDTLNDDEQLGDEEAATRAGSELEDGQEDERPEGAWRGGGSEQVVGVPGAGSEGSERRKENVVEAQFRLPPAETEAAGQRQARQKQQQQQQQQGKDNMRTQGAHVCFDGGEPSAVACSASAAATTGDDLALTESTVASALVPDKVRGERHLAGGVGGGSESSDERLNLRPEINNNTKENNNNNNHPNNTCPGQGEPERRIIGELLASNWVKTSEEKERKGLDFPEKKEHNYLFIAATTSSSPETCPASHHQVGQLTAAGQPASRQVEQAGREEAGSLPLVDGDSAAKTNSQHHERAATAASETSRTNNTGQQLIDDKFKHSLNHIIARRCSTPGQLVQQVEDTPMGQQQPVNRGSNQGSGGRDKDMASSAGKRAHKGCNKELRGLSRYYYALLRSGKRRSKAAVAHEKKNKTLNGDDKRPAMHDYIHSSSSSSGSSTSSSATSSTFSSPANSDDEGGAQAGRAATAGRHQLAVVDDKKLVRAAKKCSRLYLELEKILADRAAAKASTSAKPAVKRKRQRAPKGELNEGADNEEPGADEADEEEDDDDDYLSNYYAKASSSQAGGGGGLRHLAPGATETGTTDDQVSLSSSSVSSESIPEMRQRQNLQKLYHVVNEIYSSEAKFVDTLHLLNVDFRAHILAGARTTGEGPQPSLTSQKCASSSSLNNSLPFSGTQPCVPGDCLNSMLKHLPQLQALNENLLAELKLARDQWPKTQKIAHVLLKIGPFLKHYSTYIREFESIQQQLVDSMKRYPQFGERVREFEASERSQKLSIQHHLLKPIQRIPQYRLLLQQYLHYLKPDDVDYEDTVNALEVVSRVAEHANQAMSEGANFAKLLALQAKIVGKQRDIVQPGRLFIKEGELMKVCRKQVQPRWFILLNDALLYLTQIQSSDILYLNNELPLDDCQVSTPGESKKHGANLIGQQFETEFSVCTRTRSFALIAKSRQERDDWLTAFRATIEDHQARRRSFEVGSSSTSSLSLPSPSSSFSFSCSTAPAGLAENGNSSHQLHLGLKAPLWTPDSRVTMCQLCTSSFSALFRRHHCRACGRVVCSACSSNKAPLIYLKCRSARVCDQCFHTLKANIHLYYLPHEQLHGRHPRPAPDELRRLDEHFRTLLKSQFVRQVGLSRLNRLARSSSGASSSGGGGEVRVLREVGANDSGSLISGYLHRRQPRRAKWKRRWFVIKDNVLYAYRAIDDVATISTLPLLGYQVEQPSEPVDGLEPLSLLRLRHTPEYGAKGWPGKSPNCQLPAGNSLVKSESGDLTITAQPQAPTKRKGSAALQPPVLEHLFKAESVGAAERWLEAFKKSVVLEEL